MFYLTRFLAEEKNRSMAAGVPGASNPNNPVVFFDIAIGGQVDMHLYDLNSILRLALCYFFSVCLFVQAVASAKRVLGLDDAGGHS